MVICENLSINKDKDKILIQGGVWLDGRIAGVDLPRDKRIEIGLTYIRYRTFSSKKILENLWK